MKQTSEKFVYQDICTEPFYALLLGQRVAPLIVLSFIDERHQSRFVLPKYYSIFQLFFINNPYITHTNLHHIAHDYRIIILVMLVM